MKLHSLKFTYSMRCKFGVQKDDNSRRQSKEAKYVPMLGPPMPIYKIVHMHVYLFIILCICVLVRARVCVYI